MSHAAHNGPAGTILHDGCHTCDDRAHDPLAGLALLDEHNFRQAWADMLTDRWPGGDPDGLDRELSANDERILYALYLIAVLLQRHAGQNPHDTLAAIDARAADSRGGGNS